MEEQRVAIKFCCKVNFLATKTVALIQKAHSDATLSRTTILSGTNGYERVESQ